jgi:hypothetical protein
MEDDVFGAGSKRGTVPSPGDISGRVQLGTDTEFKTSTELAGVLTESAMSFFFWLMTSCSLVGRQQRFYFQDQSNLNPKNVGTGSYISFCTLY